MSVILEHLVHSNYKITGLLTKNERKSWVISVIEIIRRLFMKTGIYWKDEFIYKSPFSSFVLPQNFAKIHHIPVFFSTTMEENAKLKKFLSSNHIDIILTAGFHKLLPDYIINTPRLYSVNLHPSLLPKHRGGTPNRWVVRHGERQTGITAHVLTEKFDEGNILKQFVISVDTNDNWGDVEHKIMNELPRFVDELLQDIKNGSIHEITQNHSDASYEKPLKRNLLQIDWNLSAQSILQLCKAVRPITGAMTEYDNQPFCIWDGKVIHSVSFEKPGNIISISDKGFVSVQCGKDILEIHQFFYRGKIISAKKMVNKFHFQTGMRFG